MTLKRIEERLARDDLALMGGFHPLGTDDLGAVQTVLLVGPSAGPAFWDRFTASEEYADGRPEPLDRWSRRVLDGHARTLDALPFYPFGGPPYHPFIDWARRSQQTWVSPVRLLVHERAGLWLSYRGALGLYEHLPLPAAGARPCDTCAAQPCTAACPAGALTTRGYDLPRCHAYLDTEAGRDCLDRGCRARRACPTGHAWDRPAAQSAFHMAAFHS